MSNLYIEKVSDEVETPFYATSHAACMDIKAYLPDNDIVLMPGQRMTVSTGLKMCCDPGYRIAMYPRSGLSSKLGVTLINCVGVIDADYRGVVMLPLINLSGKPVHIANGERVAQVALERLELTEVVLGLPETESNRTGGFGSTGK